VRVIRFSKNMFARLCIAVLAVSTLVSLCSAAAPSDAFLILRKRIHSEYPQALAVDVNFTVELTAYNVGKSNAYDVTIRENWGEDSFNLTDGALNKTWPVVEAGQNVTLNITLVPKQHGEMTGFRGIVSYKTSEDGPMLIGFSTPMLPHSVYPWEAYQKATASYNVQWGLFASGLVLFTLLPFIMNRMYAAEFSRKVKTA